MKKQFYDINKLLNMKDINKNTPEIFIVVSNRSSGKTTQINKYAVNNFIKHKKKFVLLYRFTYELESCAQNFFKDIQKLFFPSYELESIKRNNGVFYELFLNKKPCGYAISLNQADQLKKCSHLLSDSELMIFDEFQSETNKYCSKEVEKLQSIHTSIARGNGESVRYLPIIMASNMVSLLNPYYVALGISNKLRKDTKFFRGTGFVLEQYFNEYSSEAQKQSAFNQAFNTDYLAYSTQNVYLNDSETFIESITGKSTYLCTLKFKNKVFAVLSYEELGLLYCTDKADHTYPVKICCTTEDHQINYIMLKKNDVLIQFMRKVFELGMFRFKNLQCKNAIITILSY